jgi:hypothetical protein
MGRRAPADPAAKEKMRFDLLDAVMKSFVPFELVTDLACVVLSYCQPGPMITFVPVSLDLGCCKAVDACCS